ncbi:TIGR03767 family metallophosphoesterase [Nocardioides sp. SR21]|uniref:TIGR03767 family metallophosphoesterase n=1 Tax=Nocardioides sp. SR21 TaxID=2919501 RepID=UPI001FA9882F|nr:TIGR03767 family metallophosphoesterase [Nocardioides sp. SR21]
MQISRRDLFRSSAAVGAVAAFSGLGSGLSAQAVTGSPALRHGHSGTTAKSVLLKGEPDAVTGWRSVVTGPGDKYVVRRLGAKPKAGRAKRRKPILAFAQLSDVHIVDSQSPGRLEAYDRGDDPDVPNTNPGFYKSAWRPQEILGAHVADAMVRQINAIRRGPVTGKPLAFAVQTGDNSDNGQKNEIRWNIDVLDGGSVRVDSGDLTKYEGVIDGDVATYDVRYWHPEGTPEGLEDDLPRSKFGFPTVPGLLDAARAPFEAEGLAMPWYTAFGNHDSLRQGNWAWEDDWTAKVTGDQLLVSPGVNRTVTPDPERRPLTKQEWIEEHFVSNNPDAAGPVGHGFKQANRDKGTGYYYFDKGLVRFIVLDTVNPNGNQNGSIDPTQLAWLTSLLKKSKKKLVILASHHTLSTMKNAQTGIVDDVPRVLRDEIMFALAPFDNVIAWVNGHTHTNQIWPQQFKGMPLKFWEINTASHIDWPQQARLIEVADNKDGTISIFTTLLDHSGGDFEGDLEDPVQLAALSRDLSANDWQEQGKDRRGAKDARNTELVLKAPKFMR